MRLMISGGGTGGHVYPALAVVQELSSSTEIMWVGSRGGMEEALVKKAGLPYQGIAAAGLRGKNLVAAIAGLVRLIWGYTQSRQLIAAFKPDVLFVTGGYVCVPTTLAARRAGVPVVIYLPDIEPGQAIKFLSRLAVKIAVTAPPAQKFFPTGLTVVTGYPVRPELYRLDKQQARATLNIEGNRPVVLAFGGSQGARSINQAIIRPGTLAHLLQNTDLIHISGTKDAAQTQAVYQQLPPDWQRHYHLYPYLHAEMAAAFVAADVIISRAGASILGEAPAVGTPSILVPYPYSGAHQWLNARYMAEQNAAIVIPDETLADALWPAIDSLLNDPTHRATMSTAAQELARPHAAQSIAALLQEVRHERRVEH